MVVRIVGGSADNSLLLGHAVAILLTLYINKVINISVIQSEKTTRCARGRMKETGKK